MSCVTKKPVLGFPTRADKNWAAPAQKMARGLKFRIQEVEGLYYLCSEIKGADQLRSYHGGKSKGTTCVVDRDVTAYMVVDRVLLFPTEQYGCRYGGYPGFNDVKVIF